MESFRLIGLKLSKKTSNEQGQSSKDCGDLWQYFEENKVSSLIPDKISEAIYAVYYDYEHDEQGKFSYFIGCPVEFHANKPEGLDELIIPNQKYHQEVAKGQLPTCISEVWNQIWNSAIPRKFGFDFEIYDERNVNWNDAEVDIYISINDFS
ncbi:MAG: GyrI-like domain-containing protein [Mongoliitalea sp.]